MAFFFFFFLHGYASRCPSSAVHLDHGEGEVAEWQKLPGAEAALWNRPCWSSHLAVAAVIICAM